ncbi:hypothetical protein NtRootA1_47410 [Arthrobacter sp. NtRootA1]|nr:hypothetical protein NtRootA1_47410 [Arthrobacter sp. NtRootA1]
MRLKLVKDARAEAVVAHAADPVSVQAHGRKSHGDIGLSTTNPAVEFGGEVKGNSLDRGKHGHCFANAYS